MRRGSHATPSLLQCARPDAYSPAPEVSPWTSSTTLSFPPASFANPPEVVEHYNIMRLDGSARLWSRFYEGGFRPYHMRP